MKILSQILGPLALVLTLAPAILFMTKTVTDGTMKGLMLLGFVLWFIAAPRFMAGGDR